MVFRAKVLGLCDAAGSRETSEILIRNQQVGGSSPLCSTIYFNELDQIWLARQVFQVPPRYHNLQNRYLSAPTTLDAYSAPTREFDVGLGVTTRMRTVYDLTARLSGAANPQLCREHNNSRSARPV